MRGWRRPDHDNMTLTRPERLAEATVPHIAAAGARRRAGSIASASAASATDGRRMSGASRRSRWPGCGPPSPMSSAFDEPLAGSRAAAQIYALSTGWSSTEAVAGQQLPELLGVWRSDCGRVARRQSARWWRNGQNTRCYGYVWRQGGIVTARAAADERGVLPARDRRADVRAPIGPQFFVAANSS